MAGTEGCVRGDLGSTLGLTCYEKDFEQKSGPSILRGASGIDLALNIGTAPHSRFFIPTHLHGDNDELDHPRLYRPAFRLRNHDVYRHPLKHR